MSSPPPSSRKRTPNEIKDLKSRLAALEAAAAEAQEPVASSRLNERVRVLKKEIAASEPPIPIVVQAPAPDPKKSDHHAVWQKWAAIGVSAIVALGGGAFFTKGCSNKEEIDKLNRRVEKCEQNVSQLYDHVRNVKKSEESHRRATGAAWRKHPMGEVILEGVLQNGRVESESMNPPVTRVEERVEPYPPVPSEIK